MLQIRQFNAEAQLMGAIPVLLLKEQWHRPLLAVTFTSEKEAVRKQ